MTVFFRHLFSVFFITSRHDDFRSHSFIMFTVWALHNSGYNEIVLTWT